MAAILTIPTWSEALARMPSPPTGDQLLSLFLESTASRGLSLYEAQEEAILELYSGKNVILNTPTGSGKSLVASALQLHAFALGRRSVYTCPIKALVNEKFLNLCREFGPEHVGMVTGDASVNPDAPILCCTAEILANLALRLGREAPVDDVVIDEFHYYSDRERGAAWQIPLLRLPQARFLLMSATLGDTELFERGLTKLNGRGTVAVRSTHRPVPLDFEYRDIPLHETIADLIRKGRSPIYLVGFTQASCAEEAQNLMSVDFCTKEEKRAIADSLVGTKFSSPYGKELQRFLRHGVGVHHAGLLPRYRILVERLAQRGLLKVICGTDTLGVGVNVPIRTVLFTKLCKYDGEKTGLLSVRDFQQISGRAGRKGFDDRGTVVAQAPEHVIENLKNELKAAGDAKKIKKLVKRKPPEKGYVAWSEETFRKLIDGKPEPLVSRFQVTHGLLLNVLTRPEGCREMMGLIRDCHEQPSQKPRLRRHAFALFRSLVERNIVSIRPPGGEGPKLQLHIDLQDDFSLNHALSLYLFDTLKLLDRADADYPLDVLTLVESILESPELILRRQVDRLKTLRMSELKEQGMDFDQRIEELEKVEHPKPNRDFIYDTFNDFAAKHPWVGQDNIRPKSIAREMYETFQSFAEYVREYDLERAEGLLLRYLSDVYKTLAQNVPERDRTDQAEEMITYFRELVRSIDSSLIDEWERMKRGETGPAEAEAEPGAEAQRPRDLTSDPRAFAAAVKNEVFRFLRAFSQKDAAGAAEIGSGGTVPEALTAEALAERIERYFATHARLRTDTPARGSMHTKISRCDEDWKIEQTLVDPEGQNDWQLKGRIVLARARAEDRAVLEVTALEPI